MKTTRLITFALVACLTLPALSTLPPAAAQQAPTVVAGVPLVDQGNLVQFLYARFTNVNNQEDAEGRQPVCAAQTGAPVPVPDGAPVDPTVGGPRFLGFAPAPASTASPRAPCTFPAGVQGAEQDPIEFIFRTPTTSLVLRDFHIHGSTSLNYRHTGTLPSGATITASLLTDGRTIAQGTNTTPANQPPQRVASMDLRLVGDAANTGIATIRANRTLKLSIEVTVPGGGATGLPTTSAPTWQLVDSDSYLTIRSADLVRAATWIEDENRIVRDVFKPIDNSTARGSERLVGRFALQSALAIEDASRGSRPVFSLILNGEPQQIGAGGASFLVGEPNSSGSVPSQGLQVWNFPADTLNYVNFKPGAYEVKVEKSHHQGAPIREGVSHRVLITSPSAALRPFGTSLEDPPHVPKETTSHAVQPGFSTTYLLELNNTGDVNDTFSLNLSTPNLAGGWSVVMGGPSVANRRVSVPGGEERLVTVTVSAPFGAATGAQAIAIVNATSTVDPGARSTDVILTTVVDPVLRREVAVVVPSTTRNVDIDPGIDHEIPVYVWNRGTRVANTSIEIQGGITEGWTVNFAQGTLLSRRVTLANVQPGGIAEATLHVRSPFNDATPQNVNLNATITDAPGVTDDYPITFIPGVVSGVSVQVLSNIGATGHVAEVVENVLLPDGQTPDPTICQDPTAQGDPCADDGVDGTWFRVWITNTGKVTDTFRLTADSAAWPNVPSDCEDTIFLPHETNDRFRFYYRSPSGAPQGITEILNLEPGRTAEVYVWRPADRFQDLCEDDSGDDYFSFVVQAEGVQRGARGRATAEVVAKNEGGVSAVLVEGVSRPAGYSFERPYVDTTNDTKRTITGFVSIGDNKTYRVRVTSGASWANWTSQDQGRNVNHTPNVTFQVVNFDRETGWNVSFRPVIEGRDDPKVDYEDNPWTRIYNLSNYQTAGTSVCPASRSACRQGWFDREFEVRISTPSIENVTALAGDVFQTTLGASINGTNVGSSLNIRTVVSALAKVEMRAESLEILAHANEPAAFQIYIANNGSAPTTATLRASMLEGTPNNWRIEPASQTFTIPAFRNRTVAIFVTPPANAGQGQTAKANLTIEYVQNEAARINLTSRLTLTTTVAPPGNLQLVMTGPAEATIAPGGIANFSLQMRNRQSGGQIPYALTTSQISGWNVQPATETGNLNGGETRNFVVVMRAPLDVTNGSRFSTIVRIEEPGVSADFATAALTVNILGGQALPSLFVPTPTKRVDRDGVQNFEVSVRNLGSAAGRIPIEVRVADSAWSASVQNARGDNISEVVLGPNEAAQINVSVRAPFLVPERTSVSVDLTAYTPDHAQSTKYTLQADIHDYGVDVSIDPPSKDALPGQPVEFLVKIRNTGNDNDTLNLSANLRDLPEWSVQLVAEEVRLEPGQEQEVRASVRSPLTPLTPPRSYSFQFYAGTRGGQAVNITKNDTAIAVVTIPNYRALDVDRDDQVELAVDFDKRTQNGFEAFREISNAGLQTNVVASGLFRNKTAFFLDIPRDRPYDGVADVWFDPESVYASDIVHTPDMNGDGTPDYLLDTDRDGKIDQVFDTVTQKYYTASEIKVFGDDRIQYIVDVTGDGKVDRFYDPQGPTGKQVTRTQAAADQGPDVVGIDLDGDNKIDRYYNTRTNDVSQAVVGNFGSFAREFWYFFVGFGLLVLLTVVLLVRRRRA